MLQSSIWTSTARAAARRGVWPWLIATLRLWRRRAQERAALAQFSERALRDIGVTPLEARREVNKPFWEP